MGLLAYRNRYSHFRTPTLPRRIPPLVTLLSRNRFRIRMNDAGATNFAGSRGCDCARVLTLVPGTPSVHTVQVTSEPPSRTAAGGGPGRRPHGGVGSGRTGWA